MGRRLPVRPIDALFLLPIVAYGGWKAVQHPPAHGLQRSRFAEQVNLEPLFSTAVQADGRLRSFESHAKTYMGYVYGPRTIDGQPHGFTYLDLIFRPDRYADADIVYVKNKQVRKQIIEVLKGHRDVDDARAERIFKSGLISRALLMQPDVVELLRRLDRDLIRTSKSVSAIQSALAVSSARFLEDHLRMVPPSNGDPTDAWAPISQSGALGIAPRDAVHASVAGGAAVTGMPDDLQTRIAETWTALRQAWVAEDTSAVHARTEQLAQMLTTVSPETYPSRSRLAMESWYFRSKGMTWVWLFYLAAVVPLLMSVIYKWSRARAIGLGMFTVAFTAHTASVGLRWYISGRWPNANMFEAVTTSAWFGGVAAIILERIARRTPLGGLFALGSAVISMAALMATYFLPARLDAGISNKMAALEDVWLYIHTNVIIWSYAIIGLACVPALLTLRHRWCLLWDQRRVPRIRLLVLPIALGALNYTGYRLLMNMVGGPTYELSGRALLGVAAGFWTSLLITVMELLSTRARAAAGGSAEHAAAGGAASIILAPSQAAGFLNPKKPTTSQVFDAATMVLIELAFVMLWTGIIMGAIWADHSWGRPWGWDPKEVFALNTFIIFLILIHVRLKVRDKAFWTSIIAVAGFEVMMFNWIVVNFVITGLHSYA
ncbi:MAG: cytochrome c biogenesis protein CcsA [Phycisphaerae bacterium]